MNKDVVKINTNTKMFFVEVLNYNHDGQPYFETEEINAEMFDIHQTGALIFFVGKIPVTTYGPGMWKNIDSKCLLPE